MKKLFIKAAVVTLLFGTISGCKGAMPAQYGGGCTNRGKVYGGCVDR